MDVDPKLIRLLNTVVDLPEFPPDVFQTNLTLYRKFRWRTLLEDTKTSKVWTKFQNRILLEILQALVNYHHDDDYLPVDSAWEYLKTIFPNITNIVLSPSTQKLVDFVLKYEKQLLALVTTRSGVDNLTFPGVKSSKRRWAVRCLAYLVDLSLKLKISLDHLITRYLWSLVSLQIVFASKTYSISPMNTKLNCVLLVAPPEPIETYSENQDLRYYIENKTGCGVNLIYAKMTSPANIKKFIDSVTHDVTVSSKPARQSGINLQVRFDQLGIFNVLDTIISMNGQETSYDLFVSVIVSEDGWNSDEILLTNGFIADAAMCILRSHIDKGNYTQNGVWESSTQSLNVFKLNDNPQLIFGWIKTEILRDYILNAIVSTSRVGIINNDLLETENDPYLMTVRGTNLCTEVYCPAAVDRPGICNLASINLGHFSILEEPGVFMDIVKLTQELLLYNNQREIELDCSTKTCCRLFAPFGINILNHQASFLLSPNPGELDYVEFVKNSYQQLSFILGISIPQVPKTITIPKNAKFTTAILPATNSSLRIGSNPNWIPLEDYYLTTARGTFLIDLLWKEILIHTTGEIKKNSHGGIIRFTSSGTNLLDSPIQQANIWFNLQLNLNQGMSIVIHSPSLDTGVLKEIIQKGFDKLVKTIIYYWIVNKGHRSQLYGSKACLTCN